VRRNSDGGINIIKGKVESRLTTRNDTMGRKGLGLEMTEAWKQWEGQVVDGQFRLREYLGGSEHSGAFLTEQLLRQPQKAVIKLVPVEPEKAKLQLSRVESAAKLSHPGLIRLFQWGLCQLGDLGLLYVVMEYAEEDLSQVIPHRPLTPEEAHKMLVPTVEALAYVHGEGFAHGHLKPANIMAVDDQLKISGDGLYRMGDPSGGQWKPGVYDPPEIADGRISPAGDVWALAMTLVEALTQRLPVWEGTGEAVMPATLPAPYLDIARHCLQEDPQRRWTLADIAARLQQNSSAQWEKATAKSHAAFAKRPYAVPSVALGLVLAAVLVGPRLVQRRPEVERAISVPVQHPRLQPKPEQKPVTLKTGQSTQTASPAPAPSKSKAGKMTRTAVLVPGEVVHHVLPDVPQKARDTIQGKVRVKVELRVDLAGRVEGAKLDSPGTSRYFDDLALQAARLWKFAPAKVDGRDVSSAWILRFEFGRIATEVHPVRVAP
jgi:TonB family protein